MSKAMPYELTGFLTESDVEQKFLFPFITADGPLGLGYPASSVITKQNINSQVIGKGNSRKRYYPDYLLTVGGFPVSVLEAKAPGEPLDEALREARMYSLEINAKFNNQNPITVVVACNGDAIAVSRWDYDGPHLELSLSELSVGHIGLADLLDLCSYDTLKRKIESIQASQRKSYYVATRLLGGQAILDATLPPNSFGSTISLQYREIFNPTSLEDRKNVVLHGYVPSQRRERIVDPIDRIIRATSPISETNSTLIDNTENADQLLDKLSSARYTATNQVILIVGGAGSGKTTFIDYLREVRLPRELRASTHWANINLNNAPVSAQEIYGWVCEQLINNFIDANKSYDFDDLETIEKVFYVEIGKAKKGSLKLLESNPQEYSKELYHLVTSLLADRRGYAKALARFTCAGAPKRLIIVFDNCDKRDRDEQLLMFQVAQWLNTEFSCLIILPLREETYENHRDQPPLDTAVKDLVFRFQPPQFQEVLSKRIQMALHDKRPASQNQYFISNGLRVTYTGADQEAYLLCILRSIYEHDKLVRRLITGLAGRNLRKALELFLDFCKSGHISEEIFFKIRQSDGKFVLPLHIVTRAFLYGSRKYYKSDASHIKNILALNPSDPTPSYFTRFAILRWLESNISIEGPTKLQGYHQATKVIEDLVVAGFDGEAVFREMQYLVSANCVVTESLRSESLSTDDLVRLSPAGFVHLHLLSSPQYYAAIAEEMQFLTKDAAQRVSESIAGYEHFYRETVAANASEVLDLLEESVLERSNIANDILRTDSVSWFFSGDEMVQWGRKAIESFAAVDPWTAEAKSYRVGDIVDGIVERVIQVGLIVSFGTGLSGLLHRQQLDADQWSVLSECETAILKVQIARIHWAKNRISLDLVSILDV